MRLQYSHEKSLLLILGVNSVFILLTLLWMSNGGFDFTDEGYYINLIENPQIYKNTVTQFHFIYHPIFNFLNKDIASIRIFNILTVYLFSFLAAYATLRKQIHPWTIGKASFGSVLLATTALLIFSTALYTPSYNSLNFISINLIYIGFRLLDQNRISHSNFPIFLISIALCLSFLAKPTSTFFLLAFFLFFVWQFDGRKKDKCSLVFRVFICSIFLSTVVATYIDGGPYAFLTRIADGVEHLQLLQAGHDFKFMFRFNRIQTTLFEKLLLLGLIFLLIAINFLAMSKKRYFASIGALFWSFVALFSLAAFLTPQYPELQLKIQKEILLLAAVVAFSIALISVIKQFAFENTKNPEFKFLLFLSVCPFIYAFGTNNNYWYTASLVGFFWILMLVALIAHSVDKNHKKLLLFLAAGSQLIVSIGLWNGYNSGYRQDTTLWAMQQAMPVGAPESMLKLSASYAQYISDARSRSAAAGFNPGDPIVDLTGESPGLTYTMRAISIGQAWFVGGYPGSSQMATNALKYVDCKMLAKAWLLTEPHGSRRLPVSLLNQFNLNIDEHYALAAQWFGPNVENPREAGRLQLLYRPLSQSPVELKLCKQ